MDYYNSIGSFASIQLPTKKTNEEVAGEIGGIPGLFGNRFMIANFSFLVIVWVSVSVSFNGLLYYMGRLPGNKFENVYLTTVMDTISYLFTYFVIEKTNRRGEP